MYKRDPPCPRVTVSETTHTHTHVRYLYMVHRPGKATRRGYISISRQSLFFWRGFFLFVVAGSIVCRIEIQSSP